MKTFRPLICLSSVQKSIIKYLKKKTETLPWESSSRHFKSNEKCKWLITRYWWVRLLIETSSEQVVYDMKHFTLFSRVYILITVNADIRQKAANWTYLLWGFVQINLPFLPRPTPLPTRVLSKSERKNKTLKIIIIIH